MVEGRIKRLNFFIFWPLKVGLYDFCHGPEYFRQIFTTENSPTKTFAIAIPTHEKKLLRIFIS